MEVYQTRIFEASGLKYRIQMRQNSGLWQQRHIWFPAPSTYVSEPRAGEWILSTQIPPGESYMSTDAPDADCITAAPR